MQRMPALWRCFSTITRVRAATRTWRAARLYTATRTRATRTAATTKEQTPAVPMTAAQRRQSV